MPPTYASAKPLSDREVAVLRKWVEQGAQWQSHWAYIAPERPPLPEVRARQWVRNPIDYFVLSRLEREGLSGAPEADKARLIRRVSLDLTGLPPSPSEVDAFARDSSPDAYERLVDRLLSSDRYGERMAIRWLDVSRYADTNGYQTDAERFMWRWRDWVINAFNRNMRFDQFTIEQIAGDLLPNPTLDQKIATGFSRNHRGNGEGGIIAEEYAVEYVTDRVETMSTVFLGTTMGCVRCHNHKYDPFTQRDYYGLFAYFNNIPERGKAFKYGNSPPYIPAPTLDQQQKLAALDSQLAESRQHLARLPHAAALANWQKSPAASKAAAYWVPRGLERRFSLDGSDKLESKDGPQAPVEGAMGRAESFNAKHFLDAGNVGNYDFDREFSVSAWIYPTSPSGAIVTRQQDLAEGQGWGFHLKDGKLQVNMVQRWLDDCGRVETADSLELNKWHHVVFTYDGSKLAENIKVFVDGERQKMKIHVDEMNQPFAEKEPLRIGAGQGPDNRFRGSIDEVLIYSVELTPAEIAMLADKSPVSDIAAAGSRNAAQSEKLKRYFMENEAEPDMRRAWIRVQDLDEQRRLMIRRFPTVMVMEELPGEKQSHILVRGAYDKPGDPVPRATPAVFPKPPGGIPNNRMALAKWLVDPKNPLTARVIVNRFWQSYFGAGIVKTVEDFGSQGEWPSHPELLDWLATEFIQSGWNVKQLQKTIVMSATYRQSSKVSPELAQKDPENRLLARGPRVRLSPEIVRDQALLAGGLLVEKIGGPSVKPYQPAGLWKELSGGADYQRDSGENLYRRSMYTFWKRAVPPPGMMTFDSAGRETCTVREPRTNTPLQALTLMNDVTYVEAARGMAQRMLAAATEPGQRVKYGFKLLAAREAGAVEEEVLLSSLRYYRDRFATRPAEAEKLLKEGDSPVKPGLDRKELAAYTAVASLILNLDEVITKE